MSLLDYLLLGVPAALIKNPKDAVTVVKAVSPVANLAANTAESIIDNLIRDKVSEPALGGMVYCDLHLGVASVEHSGIYIGDNKIVHLDGSGLIEVVSPSQFLGRLGGVNPAFSIYTSCRNNKAIGSAEAAARAKSRIGHTKDYGLLSNNCHTFTSECLFGNNGNSAVLFKTLTAQAKEKLGYIEWRVWDI